MDQTLKYVLPKIHIKKEEDSDERELDSRELFDGGVTSEVDDDTHSIEVIDINEYSEHDGEDSSQIAGDSVNDHPRLPNGNSMSNDDSCDGIQIEDIKSLNNYGDNGFAVENKGYEEDVQLVEEVIGPPKEKVKNVPIICKITKVSSTFKCVGIEPDNDRNSGTPVDNDKNNNKDEEVCNGNESPYNDCSSRADNNNWIMSEVDSVSLAMASETASLLTRKEKSEKKKKEFKKGKAAFHGPKSKIAGYVNTEEIHVPRHRGGVRKGPIKTPPFPPLNTVYSEVYDLPFQYGWRREIVYRSAALEDPKYAHKKMDVYYYAPSGKKLRSLKNIQAYLEKTNDTAITIDSFTFRRIRLTHDNSAEVIRCAFNTPNRKSINSSNTAAVQETSPAGPVTKKVKRCKLENGIVIKMEVDDANGFCGTPVRSDEGIPTCSSHCPGQQGVIPTLHCNGCLCLFHPQCVGIQDPDAYLPDFMCKECYDKDMVHEGKDINDSKSGPVVQSTVEEPIHLQQTAAVQTDNECEVQSLSNPVPPVPADQDTLLKMYSASSKSSISSLPSTRHYSCGVTIHKVGQPPTLHPTTAKTSSAQIDTASISVIPVPPKSVTARVTIPSIPNADLVSKSVIQPNVRFLLPAVSAGPGTAVSQLTTPTAIFNSPQPTITNTYAVSNNTLIPIQLNLPSTTNTLTSLQSIIPIVSNVVRQSAPPTPVLTSVTSLKTQTPVIRHDYSRLASQNSTSLLKGVNLSDSSSKPSVTQAALSASEHAYNKPKVKIRLSALSAKSSASLFLGECSMSMLHGGFNGMLRIFHFLTLPDLMRASQVCRTWRNIVSHPMLWQAVNLKNCRITSWEGFARHMHRYGVRRLDLRGMCLFEDKNRTWHEFVSVLPELRDVTHLDLGEVPAPIVHTVCNLLTELKGFTAEWIVDGTKDNLNPTSHCRLSVNKLSQMTALEMLRIRGVYGLHLPSPDSGLNCLENLTNLKCLSITSLKDLHSPSFDFLRSWDNLVALELGDCNSWNEETYESVSHLTGLQKLRLEFGGNSSQKGLVKALQKLQNLMQLELILFQIPNEMGEVLAVLTKLKSLSIWPDLSESPAKNNYNTLEALKQVPYLKSFTWGLVTSSLCSNKPGEKFDHQSSCIPFLVKNTTSASLAEVKINAGLLMNKLRVALPSSKVQVMMVPNSSYCTIGYMPR